MLLEGSARDSLHRERMALARQVAADLPSRPGVAGVVLYGSLALGDPPELTPFSDVDLALILEEPLPAHFAEHRVLDDIKVDVTLLSADVVRGFADVPPQRLYQHGWL